MFEMKVASLNGIRVVEMPYRRTAETQMMYRTEERRELDDFRISGVYAKGALPVEITQAHYDASLYAADGSQVFAAYGDICGSLCRESEEAFRQGKGVVFVGGDCRHVVGVLGAIQRSFGRDKKIGFIWLDAHGDFNTPEISPSGMLGGMPLAVSAGLCCEEWRLGAGLAEPLQCENIILADGRNLDPLEEKAVLQSGMTWVKTKDFLDAERWKAAVDALADKTDVICLHIDLDILDERFVPNHNTPEPNGPDPFVTMERIRTVMETGKVSAYTVTSVYHPIRDGQDISTLNAIRLLGAGLESWKTCPTL